MRGRRPDYAWDDISVEDRRARFLRYVTKQPDGHWRWIGKFDGLGRYGQLQINHHRKARYVGAHRLAYELWRGPIPSGLCVLHRCDRPWCVNPECLFVGTHSDNAQDMLAKGRGNPPVGERSPRAKLTEALVRAMRAAHAAGTSQRALAVQFEVSAKQVSMIVRRIQWAHVD